MSYTVEADQDLCQGHLLCQGEAPEVFGYDADADVVVLLQAHPDESQRSGVQQAVKYCPAFALTIKEDR